MISRETHPLYGQSISGKIVVFRMSKGGVATSWMMLDMVAREPALRDSSSGAPIP
ncbi:MAG: DUF126 domain-containing protein [Candidatus Latescibacteria bacterium]|nr:DUF126 domain-containing protein [Candidatus Latescibacterota bacterium]